MGIKSIYMFYYDRKLGITILKDIDGQVYKSDKHPKELLETWCLMFGSSYHGSKDTFCKVVNAYQKPAILVRVDTKMLFFPTVSENSADCIYIRYDLISRHKALPNRRTKIIFLSLQTEEFDIDYRIIHKQVERCRQFVEKISNPHVYYKQELELQCYQK